MSSFRLSRLRQKERKLLFFAGAYFGVGVAILYLRDPVAVSWKVLLGALVVFLAFGFLHLFWSFTGFAGDPFFLPLVALLSYTSLVFLYRLNPAYALRQFAWLLVGLASLWFITRWLPRYQVLAEYKYLYALAGVVALLLPIFFGVEQGGAKSWLDLGIFYVQPSEFVKILLVLFLAAYLAENRLLLAEGNYKAMGMILPSPRDWGPLLAMWGVSLLLLIFQKDLGTGLIYFATFLAMVYVSTARAAYVVLGALLFLAGAAGSYFMFDHVRLRVQVWLNPWELVDTAGYQVVQSLFALASGGLWGAGLGKGMPQYIPAVHTDFIFAAITEELGLGGALALLVVYMLLVYRGFWVAIASQDEFASLLATGLSALMGIQAIIIIAGVSKLLPLTGIALPFLSYGGSSLVANFILLGLLLNISHRIYGEVFGRKVA